MVKTYKKKEKEIVKKGNPCLHCEEQVILKGFRFCSEECSRAYRANKAFLLTLQTNDEINN